jgi:hypothetical protein
MGIRISVLKQKKKILFTRKEDKNEIEQLRNLVANFF